jgi:hypothetical protein
MENKIHVWNHQPDLDGTIQIMGFNMDVLTIQSLVLPGKPMVFKWVWSIKQWDSSIKMVGVLELQWNWRIQPSETCRLCSKQSKGTEVVNLHAPVLRRLHVISLEMEHVLCFYTLFALLQEKTLKKGYAMWISALPPWNFNRFPPWFHRSISLPQLGVAKTLLSWFILGI